MIKRLLLLFFSFNSVFLFSQIPITVNTSICVNDSIFLENNWQTTAGTYFDTLSCSGVACDTFLSTFLTINTPYTDSAEVVICEGDVYTFSNGDTTSVAGSYIDFNLSTTGCDTLVYLDLLIANTLPIDVTAHYCDPHNYPLPNGQIVNSTGIYVITLFSEHGCEFQLTTNLFIHEPMYDTVYVEICANETHIRLTNNNPFDPPMTWDTTNIPGIYTDSLKYNPAPGVYCDSFRTTYLTVHPTYNSLITAEICNGETFTMFDGTVISTPGFHNRYFQTINNCDSIIRTRLYVRPTFDTTFVTSICDNDSMLMPDGSYQNTAGLYTFNDTSEYGCDSIFRVDLSLMPTNDSLVNITICGTDYYILPLGDTARNVGLYSDTFTNVIGCDSIINTNISLHPTHFDTVPISICDYETYTLADNSMVSSAGLYTLILQSINGCDSTVTIDLSVNVSYSDTISVEICDNQTHTLPDNSIVNNTGFHLVLYSTSTSCDSAFYTDLTVHPTYNDTIYPEICDNETYTLPNTQIIDTPGFFTFNYNSINNCDSVFNVNLSINPTFFDTVNVEICDNETHTLADGALVDTTGTYTATVNTSSSCDSIVTTNLLVHPTYSDTLLDTICDSDFFILPDGSLTNVAGYHPISFQSINFCDSIVTTFLTVNPTYNTPIDVHICDDTFYIMPLGDTLTTSGIFIDTLVSALGCDSFITTTITVRPTYATPLTIDICDNEWHILPDGDSVNTNGIYIDTLPTIFGCDSIITTSLFVYPTFLDTFYVEICDNEFYTRPLNSIENTTGIYLDTLNTINGCDSVIVTDLTVYPTFNTPITIEICVNEEYVRPLNDTINIAGIYTDTLQSVYLCDSVITTTLIVHPTYLDTVDFTICDNEWHYLPNGDSTNVSSTQTDTLFSVYACDSVVTTNVTVLPTFAITYIVDICFGETYQLLDGSIVDTTGIYDVIMTAGNGCNSTITTNLTVNPIYQDTFQNSICDTEFFTLANGVQVDTAGFYTVNLFSINNCDSIVVVDLAINPTFLDTINDTICDNQTYTLPNGNIVNTQGIYTSNYTSALNCDSIIITNLTVSPTYDTTLNVYDCGPWYVLPNGSLTSSSGTSVYNLTSVSGCDSIVTLNLEIFSYIPTVHVYICDNDSFLLPNGNYVNIPGAYPVSLTSINGCDSSSTFIVNNFPTYDDTINVEICGNQTYTLPNGWNVNIANDYTFNYSSINGCDSAYTVSLSTQSIQVTIINDTICDNDNYTLPNGAVVNQTGSYNDTLLTSFACDSIIQTQLIVHPTYSSTHNVSICDNENYTLPDGNVVNTAGLYPVMLLSVNACDSLVITNLTVHSTYSNTILINRCENENYVMADGTVIDTTGLYPITLNSVNGCDSIVIIDLRIHTSFSDTNNIIICADDSIILEDGTVVNSTGNYITNFSTIWGCDSIYYTNLLVNPLYNFSQVASICDNETYTLPNGLIVDTVGVYHSILTSINGCDSTITTTLSIFSTYDSLVLPVSICDNETHELQDGTIVTTTGMYSVTLNSINGCDSVVTTNLTILPTYFDSVYSEICYDDHYLMPNGWLVNTSGIYDVTLTAINGCDSLIRTELLVHNFTNTADPIDDVTFCMEDVEPITIDYDGYDYVWNDGTLGPTINPRESDVYIVEFYLNGNNCIARDTIKVIVNDCALTCTVTAPTGFTPDEKGFNNIFRAIHTCDEGFDEFELRIYNRWGNLMYITNDPKKGWNGKYKGKDAPIATYVYIIDFLKTGNSEFEIVKGNVTLIR